MRQDELDRILLSDSQIEPAASFTAKVMARIETAAAANPRIPFPWLRLAALLPAVMIPVILFFPAKPFVHTMNSLSWDLGNWILTVSTGNAFMMASASLLGTWLLVWFSLRLAGAGR